MAAEQQFKFIDLFAGIGGIRIAFERAGAKCVFSSEIDEQAIETYKRNFGESPEGDIKKVSAKEIPDHDILAAGWPCPSFSIMGDKEGIEDERGALIFEIERILNEKQPKAFLLENVKHLTGIDKGKVFDFILNLLKSAGYHVHWEVLDARNFGLPQKRERTIIVGFQDNFAFEIPQKNDAEKDLEDILQPPEKVDDKYLATEYIRNKRKESVEEEETFTPSVWHENRSGNVSVLPYSCALRASASYNYLLVNGERHLTPREMLRLQGFPECFEVTGSYTKIRNQVGNSVPIPMIEEAAKAMIHTLKEGYQLKQDTIHIKQHDLFEEAEVE